MAFPARAGCQILRVPSWPPGVLMQAGSGGLPQLEAGTLTPGETKRDPRKNVNKRYFWSSQLRPLVFIELVIFG